MNMQHTTVRLVNHSDHPVTLSDPESNTRAFVAQLKTVQPGKEFQLIVKATPSFIRSHMRGVITLKTSLADVPTVSVPVFVFHQQARRFSKRTAGSTAQFPLNSPNQSGSVHEVRH